jgi:hypothetical protein
VHRIVHGVAHAKVELLIAVVTYCFRRGLQVFSKVTESKEDVTKVKRRGKVEIKIIPAIDIKVTKVVRHGIISMTTDLKVIFMPLNKN